MRGEDLPTKSIRTLIIAMDPLSVGDGRLRTPGWAMKNQSKTGALRGGTTLKSFLGQPEPKRSARAVRTPCWVLRADRLATLAVEKSVLRFP